MKTAITDVFRFEKDVKILKSISLPSFEKKSFSPIFSHFPKALEFDHFLFQLLTTRQVEKKWRKCY